MVEITRRKWLFIGYILRKDSAPSAGQGSFPYPKASVKEDASGLHGVEHQRRSWKIWVVLGGRQEEGAGLTMLENSCRGFMFLMAR